MTARRVAATAAAVLGVAYLATLAPDVTFWDAGEFIASAHSLGIPHPPGTPLLVLLLHAWASIASHIVRYAAATNMVSAMSTAAAAGATAWLVMQLTREPMAALAGALCAGAMSSVWLNATETEVYAASLALAVLTLVAALRASEEGGVRWLGLTSYLIALAVPLHLSALVAGPAAIMLASDRIEGVDWWRGAVLAGVWILAVGAGRMSPVLAAYGAGMVVVGGSGMARRDGAWPGVRAVVTSLGAAALAWSALLVLRVRARHDPFIHQGNPSTWPALVDVVARHQYDVAPLWPRQAPVWIQLANLAEYADWQVALGLGPGVAPTVPRTMATIAFLLLAVYGAARMRREHPRAWRLWAVLFVCGSIGVAAYLNLKAGASFGWGVLPDSAPHEARDRDYFFVLGFWAWGVWAGYGAVSFMRRLGRRDIAGVALACLPLALNWRAVSRRAEPEASVPRTWATALLAATPSHGVLVAAGDNDTYPLWYAQEVLGVRRDVHVVTLPLLVTRWYRDELRRRDSVLMAPELDVVGLWSPAELGALVVRRALAAGRPVAVSANTDAATRGALGSVGWTANGLTFVAGGSVVAPLAFDATEAARLARMVEGAASGMRESTDPADDYFSSLMGCPRYVVQRVRQGPVASLDSLCNFR
ncbi:MAG TPA: DUF2723 domain-containing protein [Gemmatimonadaceae bacterium]|nr:DUF2723 domain-containing protein [Gemmatimonadaceae bacterium]